jgi:hypothetical protein
MKNIFMFFFLFVMSPIGFASSISGGATITSEGDGYQELTLNDSQPSPVSQAIEVAKSEGEIDMSPAFKPRTSNAHDTNKVIVLKSIKGIINAPIPNWIKDDLLDEIAPDGTGKLTVDELNAPISLISIDVDSYKEAEYRATTSNQTTSNYKGVSLLGFCQKTWSSKSKKISGVMDSSLPDNKIFHDQDIDATLKSQFKGKGSYSVDVRYDIKKRCGIPYGARFNYADINADADMAGKIGLTGNLTYKKSNTLVKGEITLFEKNFDWLYLFFYFDLDLKLAVDYGINLDVRASADVDTSIDAAGPIAITWRCRSNGCQKTRNDVGIRFVNHAGSNYAISSSIILTPYMDTNLSADLDLWKTIDLANAKLGIVVAIPITYFGYYGNMCSDSMYDGFNEGVRASFLNANAEVYSYLNYSLFNKKMKYSIDINMAGYSKRTSGSLYTEQVSKAIVYEKNIFIRDFRPDEINSIFDPVIKLHRYNNNTISLELKKRDCYPFSQNITWVADWGDGSSYQSGGSNNLGHTWVNPGKYLVRVRMGEDEIGRRFEENWVSFYVEVL